MSAPTTRRSECYEGERCVYLLELNNGTVKVGVSQEPGARLYRLRCLAAGHGLETGREWVSKPHVQFMANERAAMNYAAEKADQTGLEYLQGVAFDDLKAFVETLPMDRSFSPVIRRKKAMEEEVKEQRAADIVATEVEAEETLYAAVKADRARVMSTEDYFRLHDFKHELWLVRELLKQLFGKSQPALADAVEVAIEKLKRAPRRAYDLDCLRVLYDRLAGLTDADVTATPLTPEDYKPQAS